ncbi:MAG: Xaa-Pro aminopeptidase, partial [Bacteroidia bacterium]
MEQRLVRVRQLMKSAGYDALIVPRADEYLGEYIPAHNERLQWISGFNGSAGVVVILQDTAAIFTDGRYTVAVRQEVSADSFQYHHLINEPHLPWLKNQLPEGSRVSYDPRLHSLVWQREAVRILGGGGLELIADTDNLIDRSWDDRPAANIGKAILLGEQYTGESSFDKRRRIAEAVAHIGADAALIFAPDSVSWLLNIRGTDIPCLPIVQSFAVLGVDGSVVLLVDPGRIPQGFADHVGEGVEVVAESSAQEIFQRYKGKTMLADPSACNAWTQLLLAECGATLISREDPVLLPKACKNSVEIEGTRAAHIRDAVAEVKFLAWLDSEVAKGNLYDESVLADKLLSFRQLAPEFKDSSFDTISATGANAAMCHYNFRNGLPGQMEMGSVYLVDSGAQYPDGTTDITRTIAIGDPGDDV